MNFRNLAMWAVIIVLTIGLYNMFKGPQRSASSNNNQIIFAKEGYLVDGNEKLFRLLNGKIVSINNDKRLLMRQISQV